MWIVPNNLPLLYSASAPEYLASIEGLKEPLDAPEPPLLWRSKPGPYGTWLRRWKKVYWIQHLFGRILKPSRQRLFTIAYTASLGAIRANPSASPESVKEQTTPDISGHTSLASSVQLDLFGASSKTSLDTLPLATKKSETNYTRLVTQLKREYSQRKKLALRTKGKDSSFSQWITPRVLEVEESYENYIYKMQASGNPKNVGKTKPNNLSMQVGMNWPTPKQRDYIGMSQRGVFSPKDALANMVYFQTGLKNNNTKESTLGSLNPAWVAQLMGTTIEQIFSEPWVTESSSKPQSLPSEPSSQNMD